MNHMEPFTDLQEILPATELPADVSAGAKARSEICGLTPMRIIKHASICWKRMDSCDVGSFILRMVRQELLISLPETVQTTGAAMSSRSRIMIRRQPDQSWSVREVPSGGRGFGIASMVLGIISLVLFFSFVNIPLAILAIIFGIIQLTRKAPKGMAISGIVMGISSLFLLVIFWTCMFVSAARTESTDNSTYYYEGSENDDASGDYYDGLYEGYQQGYKDGYYDGYYGYTPDEEFYGHTPDDSFYGYLPNDDSYNFHGKNGIYY